MSIALDAGQKHRHSTSFKQSSDQSTAMLWPPVMDYRESEVQPWPPPLTLGVSWPLTPRLRRRCQWPL